MFSIVNNIELTDGMCTGLGSIYVSCGWGSAYESKDIRKSFLNTDYYLVALNEIGKPLGFLRAFSDTVFATWISELIVESKSQNKGIGTALLNRFSKDFEHTAIYSFKFENSGNIFEKINIIPRKKLIAISRRPLR